MTNGYPQGTAQAKKGLHPLAWVAIGCAGILLIAGIVTVVGGFFVAQKVKQVAGDFEDNPAKAAAEIFVTMNPEIEKVESNDAEGTITIRSKKTGEVATFDYAELEKGNFSWKTEDGEGSVSFNTEGGQGGLTVTTEEGETKFGAHDFEAPAWIPMYPGATMGQSLFSSKGDQGTTASFWISTDAATQEVIDYYAEQFESAGFTSNKQTYTVGSDQPQGLVNAKNEAAGREVNVVVTRDGGETKVTFQYSEKP